MATAEQQQAAREISRAVEALNSAIRTASKAGIFVELSGELEEIGCRNRLYVVRTIETRENVRAASFPEKIPD